MPKQRVAYYYQEDVGHHYYGPGHPMKPIRIKLAHHLILTYGLYRKMECYRPHLASADELAGFHSDDYVDFLKRVTPETVKHFSTQTQRCESCPCRRSNLHPGTGCTHADTPPRHAYC